MTPSLRFLLAKDVAHNVLRCKSLFSILILFVSASPLYQQELGSNYTPAVKFSPSGEYIELLCRGYDSIYKSARFSEKNMGKAFKEALNETKKDIACFNKDTLLMRHDSITQKLQSIVDHIQQKNPLLANRRFSVFTYRTTNPNAANYGNGVIVFNLNLLAKLDREEHIAFILCHEIGHDIRGHVFESILKNYEIKNNDAFKKEFEKINKQEFNKLHSYEQYVASYLQKFTSKKRDLEVQADSVGLALYYNAGYDLQYAYNAIEKLDSTDQEIYTSKIDFNKFFGSADHPFKASWLEPEEQDETIEGGNFKDVKMPDSLKTHPDCKTRLVKMKAIRFAEKKTPFTAAGRLNPTLVSRFEMLSVYNDEFRLSKGLYNSVQLSAVYPSNQYLRCSIVDFLFEIYCARVNHYFSMVTDRPDSKNCPSYNELLYFLNNVNSEVLKEIMHGYFKRNFDSNLSDPYAAYVFALLKGVDLNKEKRFDLVNEYRKSFGENQYFSRLKVKFLPKK
jgi:Zn-dependent protease with chaperone function